MEQDCEELDGFDIDVQAALQASWPLVQPILVEDGDTVVAKEQDKPGYLMQLLVQPKLLEDSDKPVKVVLVVE